MSASANSNPSTHKNGAIEAARASARRFFLGGLGAFALVRHESNAFFQRLIERGEIAEDSSRQRLGDLFGRIRSGDAKALTSGRMPAAPGVDAVLTRVNVPTRSDVESLGRKINDLSQQIEELRAKTGI